MERKCSGRFCFRLLTFFFYLSSSRTLSGTKISSIPAELCKDLKLLRTLSVFLLYVNLYNSFCRKAPQTKPT